jgi:Ni/Co efflux regulator RcnB
MLKNLIALLSVLAFAKVAFAGAEVAKKHEEATEMSKEKGEHHDKKHHEGKEHHDKKHHDGKKEEMKEEMKEEGK